jgi:hypothetical protein
VQTCLYSYAAKSQDGKMTFSTVKHALQQEHFLTLSAPMDRAEVVNFGRVGTEDAASAVNLMLNFVQGAMNSFQLLGGATLL